jgi:hypothetical protein
MRLENMEIRRLHDLSTLRRTGLMSSSPSRRGRDAGVVVRQGS